MSAAPTHAHAPAAAHGTGPGSPSYADEFDDLPSHASDEADGTEPRTPAWLPAVGAALFLGVLLCWAVSAAPSNAGADAPSPDRAAAGEP